MTILRASNPPGVPGARPAQVSEQRAWTSSFTGARVAAVRESTSFVGRASDLAAVGRAFSRGARIVTLVGPPGIGKTRLARRFAARAGRRRGGATFCELGEARSFAEALATLGSALGVPLVDGATLDDAIEQLGRALRGRRRPLLVLDEVERIATDLGDAVARWSARAPEARTLATSREPLGVEGEVRIELLPLPDADAVRLFLDRGRAVRRRWSPDATERRALGAVVRRLDGMPLAIELAAARLEVLTPQALLQRLSRPLDVLRSDRKGVPARRATISGALDGSWDLLSPDLRIALARASVFRAGFSLPAAEAVLASVGAAALDLVEALRRKSLLRRTDDARSPEARFGLYESVQAYAAERLRDEGLVEDAEDRHGEYFLTAAEAWAEAADGPDGAACVRRLAVETENLLAVHRRFAERRPAWSARAAIALHPVLGRRGPWPAYLDLLDGAVSAGRAVGDPVLLGRALRCRGEVRRRAGPLDTARADLEEAVALGRAAGDLVLEGESLRLLGLVALRQGDAAESESLLRQAVDVLARSPSRRSEGFARASLGAPLAELGRIDEALAACRDGFLAYRALASRELEAVGLAGLGWMELLAGRLDPARAHLEEALAASREVGDRRLEGTVLDYLGELGAERGADRAAAAHLDQALRIHRELGNRTREGYCLSRLGVLALGRRRLEEARRSLERARRVFHEVGESGYEAEAVATLAALGGSVGETRAILDEARSLVRGIGQHATLRVLEGFEEVALAERAREEGDLQQARRFLDRARARAATGASAASTGVRAAARLLSLAVARADPTLGVGPDGAWFRSPGGAPVDLSRRPPLARMLAFLAQERTFHPGTAIGRDGLLSAGWPGEKVLPGAGAARVRVALSTLRRLGLRGLSTGTDGWLLDPRVPLVRG